MKIFVTLRVLRAFVVNFPCYLLAAWPRYALRTTHYALRLAGHFGFKSLNHSQMLIK
jgi:hypothetical protein